MTVSVGKGVTVAYQVGVGGITIPGVEVGTEVGD